MCDRRKCRRLCLTSLTVVARCACLVLVRLVGDDSSQDAGRLEVYYNDTWGTVCRDGFDDIDAQVACFMLGYG